MGTPLPQTHAVPEASATNAGHRGWIGLALSGGGIRSATFSLGVLQALAARNRLASFDLLSTVSGGGYIGSWLSAWIHRKGIDEVQEQLGAPSDEPPEVTWLRRYSNYLTPRVGLFSLDSLTLVTTWLRNVALNLVVLLSCLALLFIAPLLLLDPLSRTAHYSATFGYVAAWSGFAFLAAIAFNLWHESLPISRRRTWLVSTAGVMTTVLLPGLLSACTGAIWLFQGQVSTEGKRFALSYVAVLLIILLVGWALAEAFKTPPASSPKRTKVSLMKEVGIHLMSGIVAVGVGIAVLAAIDAYWQTLVGEHDATFQYALLISVGPPSFLFALGIVSSVYTGLVGRVYFERSREWWSRLNAWLLVFGGSWLVLCLLALFTLPTLAWLYEQIGNWIGLLGTGWIGSLLATLLARKPVAASTTVQSRVDSLLNLAASVFVAGLLIAVAAGTSLVVFKTAGVTSDELTVAHAPSNVSFEFESAADRVDYRASVTERHAIAFVKFVDAHIEKLAQIQTDGPIEGVGALTTLVVLLVVVLGLFGWRVDVNKFSLHNMYKNRLVRCYLGASNQEHRNEQPFTGLDDADDIPLRDLNAPKQRPVQIINTALNISQGSNLAWQERKAASFVLTPQRCGFSLARTQGDTTSVEGADGHATAYRSTDVYAARDGEEPGFTLGMALATSGAAVSPNMGHATQPARAFVLTLFNLRLGRWSPNPAGNKWEQPSPRFGLICLLQELLGYSNERRNFVYLSDGGHFENLGIYELVRQQCSVIFAVDAAQDPDRKFDDLAEAIRKCRVDLGIEITIENLELLSGNASGLADRGFVEGTIRYNATDPTQNGKLVFIKPTMRRAQDEPPDILNYAARNPPFPQQTTADQSFDESQFESYRCLGYFIGAQCLAKYADLLPEYPLADAR